MRINVRIDSLRVGHRPRLVCAKRQRYTGIIRINVSSLEEVVDVRT